MIPITPVRRTPTPTYQFFVYLGRDLLKPIVTEDILAYYPETDASHCSRFKDLNLRQSIELMGERRGGYVLSNSSSHCQIGTADSGHLN